MSEPLDPTEETVGAAATMRDLTVRHRVWLGRYSTGVVRKIMALLNRVDASVVAAIATADAGSRAADMENLLAGIDAVEAIGWAQIGEGLGTELEALGEHEAVFNGSVINAGAGLIGRTEVQLQTGQLTASQVYAATMARPFQGKLLKEWLSDAEAANARRVREVIRQGYAESQTIQDMVARIRGTAAAQYQDGILEIGRRGAEAMVRTAVTHTSNVAASDTYALANEIHPGLIESVEWVSVLDNRTTMICASRDGNIYPIDSGPRPPAHINCRSSVVPVLAGMNRMARELFPDWLLRQPHAIQDDVLGTTRGQLFRSGALSLDKFVDSKGKTLTLDQLRAKDAAAFASIGR